MSKRKTTPKPPRRLWGYWHAGRRRWFGAANSGIAAMTTKPRDLPGTDWIVAPLDPAELIALRARCKELESLRQNASEECDRLRNELYKIKKARG